MLDEQNSFTFSLIELENWLLSSSCTSSVDLNLFCNLVLIWDSVVTLYDEYIIVTLSVWCSFFETSGFKGSELRLFFYFSLLATRGTGPYWALGLAPAALPASLCKVVFEIERVQRPTSSCSIKPCQDTVNKRDPLHPLLVDPKSVTLCLRGAGRRGWCLAVIQSAQWDVW